MKFITISLVVLFLGALCAEETQKRGFDAEVDLSARMPQLNLNPMGGISGGFLKPIFDIFNTIRNLFVSPTSPLAPINNILNAFTSNLFPKTFCGQMGNPTGGGGSGGGTGDSDADPILGILTLLSTLPGVDMIIDPLIQILGGDGSDPDPILGILTFLSTLPGLDMITDPLTQMTGGGGDGSSSGPGSFLGAIPFIGPIFSEFYGKGTPPGGSNPPNTPGGIVDFLTQALGLQIGTGTPPSTGGTTPIYPNCGPTGDTFKCLLEQLGYLLNHLLGGQTGAGGAVNDLLSLVISLLTG